MNPMRRDLPGDRPMSILTWIAYKIQQVPKRQHNEILLHIITIYYQILLLNQLIQLISVITDVSIFFWGVTIHYAMWFRKNEPFHLTTFFSTRLHGLWLAPHRQSAGGAKLTRGSCRLVEIDVWLRGYGPGTNGIYRHNMILYNGGIKWWNNCIKLYYRNNMK